MAFFHFSWVLLSKSLTLPACKRPRLEAQREFEPGEQGSWFGADWMVSCALIGGVETINSLTGAGNVFISFSMLLK